MKKVLIFAAILAFLFGAFAYVNHASNVNKLAGNPYGKTDLHPDTIKQLNNPNYQNQILPEELASRLANQEDLFVYFYSSDCQFCQITSPVVVPLAQELGVDLKLFNLREFQEGWQNYKIQSTPTFVYFKNGVESTEDQRRSGAVDSSNVAQFKKWIESQRN
jgi:thioredoxin 1